MLWLILVEFLFRLSLGLAFAMLLTSPRVVTAGFFRVHLWVVLGMNTFVAAVIYLLPNFPYRQAFWISAIGAGLSYVGAVLWLYERTLPGRLALVLVVVANLTGAGLMATTDQTLRWMPMLDAITASCLLGFTFTAMLLGHWYLNTPTMKLAPLRFLVAGMAVAVGLRAVTAIVELSGIQTRLATEGSTFLALLTLRWLTGLIGVLVMAWMTWQTLKIPNTQSATGILYVAVIFVFLGELTAQLLSVAPLHPV